MYILKYPVPVLYNMHKVTKYPFFVSDCTYSNVFFILLVKVSFRFKTDYAYFVLNYMV